MTTPADVIEGIAAEMHRASANLKIGGGVWLSSIAAERIGDWAERLRDVHAFAAQQHGEPSVAVLPENS